MSSTTCRCCGTPSHLGTHRIPEDRLTVDGWAGCYYDCGHDMRVKCLIDESKDEFFWVCKSGWHDVHLRGAERVYLPLDRPDE